MKIINSPLQQVSFWMVRFEFKIRPSEKDIKASDLFPNYEVDLNFGIKEQDDLILVYTKVSVNQGENILPGYSFFAEGVTRFKLDDQKPKDKISVPCINIGIQNLRNHIASVTSDCQLGKYTFPTVNLGEMIKKKKEAAASATVQIKQVKAIRKKRLNK